VGGRKRGKEEGRGEEALHNTTCASLPPPVWLSHNMNLAICTSASGTCAAVLAWKAWSMLSGGDSMNVSVSVTRKLFYPW